MKTVRKYSSAFFSLLTFLTAAAILFSSYHATCYAYQFLRKGLANRSFEMQMGTGE